MNRCKVFLRVIIFLLLFVPTPLFGVISVYEQIWTNDYANAVLPENEEIGPLADLNTPDGALFHSISRSFFDLIERGELYKELLLPDYREILFASYAPILGNTVPVEYLAIAEVMRSTRRAIVPFYARLESGHSFTGELFFESVDGYWYLSGSSSLVDLLPQEEEEEL